LELRGKSPGNATNFEVQFTDTDPSVDTNFKASLFFGQCRKIEVSGFTPGKNYFGRIRATNGTLVGAWTLVGPTMAV
jgi:hypothetical protein